MTSNDTELNLDETEDNIKEEYETILPNDDIKEEYYYSVQSEDNQLIQNITPISKNDLFEDSVLKTLVANIHQDIKKEIAKGKRHFSPDLEDSVSPDRRLEEKEELILGINNEDEPISFRNKDCLDLKHESDNEAIVSYDYPQFDSVSADSRDSAMGGCVDDQFSVKREFEDVDATRKSEYYGCDVKLEPDLTVTETHLISNKLINTTSTITHPQEGLIESNTTQTLVMEILPMGLSSNRVGLSKFDNNPEEILPTNEYLKNDVDDIQLNSITGDCLPLEAYGLKEESKSLICPKCPNRYKCKKGLNRHLKVHQSIDRYNLGRSSAMTKRKENSIKKQTAKEAEGKGQYQCTCGKYHRRRTRMEACLKSHEVVQEDSIVCGTCLKEFKHKDDLINHRKRYHVRKKFPCKFCPIDFTTRKDLFKHLRKHQKVQLMEYKIISEVVQNGEKLKCFMCSKSYNELNDLKSHVINDHKVPYKCQLCKEKFNKVTEFVSHVKSTHPDVKWLSVLDVWEAHIKLAQAWKCDVCSCKFNQADKLALHQLEAHSCSSEVKISDIEQFQCIDCRRVFASNKSLNSHRRVHHTAEVVTEETAKIEPGYLCVYCRKICKDENALASHMRFHSSDRKYVCKFCDFRFATPEKRKAHAEIHTGDMKYVCFICEYTCSSENRLKNHKKSVKHVSMREYLLTGKPMEEDESKEKKRRVSEEDEEVPSSSKYSCDICGETFNSESLMLEHKQTHPFIEFPNEDQPSRIFFK